MNDEEDINAIVKKLIHDDMLHTDEKLRNEYPELNDAWEQIRTVRLLTKKHNAQKFEKTNPRYVSFRYIMESVNTTNPALIEAWKNYNAILNRIKNENS